ncbi:MAG: entericidin [Phycisphaerae bacterium]
MVKKLVLIFLLAILSISLISCQTISGIGGDIKWAGDSTASWLEGN